MLALQSQQEKHSRLHCKLLQELGGSLLSYLHNPAITEIMLNPDGQIWIDHQEQGMQSVGEQFSAEHAMNLIGTIADLQGTVINEHTPILETELPLEGSRFQALIPPIVSGPTFCIRKQARQIYSLDDYLARNMMTAAHVAALREAIIAQESILIAGGPGTGKTTLANALLHEMTLLGPCEQRIVLIEDTRELQCSAKNTVALKTDTTADYAALLKATLRLRPDKICLGECRGSEVFVLLKAWNTGTAGGLATIHANSAQAALTRIEEILVHSGFPAAPHFIVQAIRCIVSLTFSQHVGRKVNQVVRVQGYEQKQYQLLTII